MANVSLMANIADQRASEIAGFSAQLVPVGVILSYGGANAPTGWLLCDGRAISRTTYGLLYAVLTSNGTTFPFGSGDGSTTFNLPDLRGRFPRYDDNMGNHGISGVTASGAASRDTGRVHGSAQVDATKRPTTAFGATAAAQAFTGSVSGSTATDLTHNHTFTGRYNETGLGAFQPTYGNGTGISVNTITNNNSGNLNHSHNVTPSGSNSSSAVGTWTGGDAETRPINVAVNAIIKI